MMLKFFNKMILKVILIYIISIMLLWELFPLSALVVLMYPIIKLGIKNTFQYFLNFRVKYLKTCILYIVLLLIIVSGNKIPYYIEKQTIYSCPMMNMNSNKYIEVMNFLFRKRYIITEQIETCKVAYLNDFLLENIIYYQYNDSQEISFRERYNFLAEKSYVLLTKKSSEKLMNKYAKYDMKIFYEQTDDIKLSFRNDLLNNEEKIE